MADRTPLVLVLATRNRGKARELEALLADLPVRVRTLDDYPDVPVLPEVGRTFAENAVGKAVAVAQATGQVALADDSGLEVDALGGAPGVDSATFLGPAASDDDRNRWVLARLRGLAEGLRTARYRAVIAVASPGGAVRTFEGACEGRIAEGPRGEGGFGYDPIFIVPAYGRTMAELPPEVKNQISHRAKALAAARAYLVELAAG
ncbi:MAG: RdgB/HAM1 family non-canonical purine NTP pyrophosphatase [Armatimonadota bacterium]|nr:RdgB/HAM1 family non-canonical purine NTP pyrophosphatase [Armatimonadota bacterium]MDR7422467.1 RdgB/HAM1 family non-canonical purine NTP pyrophosphatase [Armatimonadota bacterium]MDR7452953.1 RdgB/HAM1 family non-canonical purine NTP pyrophosphatase [Armatimonadota bacterium]MDR7456352.1 RdgB/HAM1 family non-canonical purine NTP pyrophosphatase [Armatimonadota bacterium]MDR7496702.1 RdgB/HAM1 family non-canonical purine NTP pyrophosphatase [Armatimonadota bacterium]